MTSLQQAIDRFAGLFEYGHLLLETCPADLINQACDEIESLRAMIAATSGGEVIMQLTDRDLMPFGKHKGKPMADVPAEYLDWLDGEITRSRMAGERQTRQTAEVHRYINENRKAINAELEAATSGGEG